MKKRRSVIDRGHSRQSLRRARPLMERVEDRILMTQFVVSDLSDDPTDANSLRGAILASNADATNLPNSIVFSGLTGAGPFTITPNLGGDGFGPLPAITEPVSIDATTVPGFNSATNVPMVEITGAALGTGGVGLELSVAGVTIRGFDIDHTSGAGISIDTAGNDIIDGNYIGPDITGTKSGGNQSGTGILVSAGHNTIGGTTQADRNVIGSVGYGIDMLTGAGDNVIQGNYIGTNVSGTAALPGNTQISPLFSAGILGNDVAFDTIGGSAAGAGNLISGFDFGVQINNSSFEHVYGNDIGTDYTGLVKIGNTFDGVFLNDSFSTTIGGVAGSDTNTSGAGNVLSGNGRYGLFITGGGGNLVIDLVQNNLIGVGSDGTTAIGNGAYGIYLQGAGNCTIGGALPGTGSPSNLAQEKQLGNTIAYSGKITPSSGAGVEVQGNVQADGILSNSIFANVGPGIQFTGGVNEFVTPPTLNSVASGGGETQVDLNLNEPRPDTDYLVQIFSSPVEPTTGFEQGKTFIGDAIVTTDDFGAASNVLLTLPVSTGIGEYVTATATQQALQVPNSSIFSQAQVVVQATVADLSVAVSPQANAPLVGQPYTYTIVVANNGPDDAGGVTLTDTLPTNATFVSSSVGSYSNGVFNANIGNLTASPKLTVVSIPGTSQPVAGQDYTYKVKVTNTGTIDAANVVLSDLIPANTAFVSASSGALKAGSVVDPVGFLAPGDSSTVTITVKPNASGPLSDTPSVTGAGAVTVILTIKPTSASSVFTNTATVTSTVLQDIDPDLTNNTAITKTPNGVQPDAVLSISLLPVENPTPIGQPQDFVLTLVNKGPSTVSQATITVVLPSNYSNLTVDPDQGTYSVSGSTITIKTGILPSSGTSTINLSGTPNAVGGFSVTASVSSPTVNPDPTEATITVPVTVENSADLDLSLTSTPNPVLLGQTLDYTATIVNNGPSTSSNAVITDTLPAGLTFDPSASSDSGGGTFSFANGVVTITLNPILGNGTDVATIAVIPTLSGPIANTVSVADADVIDPDLTNNSGTVTTLVSPADLQVTLINPTDPIFIGTQATYQIQVENLGPADAANVTLVDDLGPYATIVSTSVGSVASTANGSELTANLGTITSGSTVTVTITIDPTVSGMLADTATASSPQYDPNSNNNSQSVTNLVSPADLGVTVSGSPSPVLIGAQFAYLVTVTNNGPATATNVAIADALPAGTTYVTSFTSQGSVAVNGLALAGNLGSLAPGASAEVTIFLTGNSVETVIDTASVSSDNIDTVPGNNIASGSVSVINLAGTIEIASPVTYVAENAGFVTLTLVRVGGSLGTVTADYQTNDYTGVAGVNYTATTGTVTFIDGQTTATITIPVLDDFKVDASTGFFVFLTNPTGGASLDSNNVAAVVVYNTDIDVVPPIVTGFTALPNTNPNLFNGFLITFDKELNPVRANLVSNYHVTMIDPKTGAQTPVTLAAAVFDPTTDDVALIPTSVLPGNRFYHVIVNGSYGPALTDLSGNILYGSTGLGTNYDIYYGHGTSFNYDDSMGNAVNIAISGGGTLDIVRGPTGDAASVTVLNPVPHKTKLTGSVKKLSKKASGHTTINEIIGLGQFGNVYSTLTTPSFYVGSAPVSIASVGSTLSATSVTVGKKSPKGPKSR